MVANKNFSDQDFLEKLKMYSKSIGKDLVFKSLLLFYALKEESTPKWAKSTIVGALIYLVVPIDAIPDFIPLAGYSDDLGVIAAALGVVYLSITDKVKEKARNKLNSIFTNSQ